MSDERRIVEGAELAAAARASTSIAVETGSALPRGAHELARAQQVEREGFRREAFLLRELMDPHDLTGKDPVAEPLRVTARGAVEDWLEVKNRYERAEREAADEERSRSPATFRRQSGASAWERIYGGRGIEPRA